MTLKQRILALGVGALMAIAALSYIPTNAHALEAKYQLTITITPVAAQLARGARMVIVTPKEEPSHGAFDSKDECELHFASDAANLAISFAQLGIASDQYEITHVCEPAGTDL